MLCTLHYTFLYKIVFLRLVSANQRMEVNLDNAYYMERLMEIEMSENVHLNLNLQHVANFNENLYKMIVAYPAVNFH